MYDWAIASVPTIGEHTPGGWTRRPLVRPQITPTSAEPELAYYLCCAPATWSDEELLRVTGSHWAIEECFQTASTEVGLTLVMLAHTYLAVTAAVAPKALATASPRSPSAKSVVYWHT